MSKRQQELFPNIPSSKTYVSDYPELAAEWHPTKNKGLLPEDVLHKSNKFAWWLCKQGHEYRTVVHSRTTQSTGCPYCAGKKASPEYNLLTLNPDIAAEWNYQKNTFLPSEVVPGSNKKVWWVCDRKHEWQTSVAHRTKMGRGCPKCSNQSSRNEIRILTEFLAVFEKVQHRSRHGGFELDIVIPEYNAAVEYDGAFWHNDKSEQDEEKQKHVTALGLKLIRVREEPLPKINDWDIIVPRRGDIKKRILDELICWITDHNNKNDAVITEYLSEAQFKQELKYRAYLEAFPSPLPEVSLMAVNPEVAKEWHPSLNAPLEPYNFLPNSTFKAWWLCSNGHEYQQTIVRRNHTGSTCLKCKSFGSTHPEIAKMFHPTKNNERTIFDFTYGNNERFVWRCLDNPEHEWVLSPKQMTAPRKQKHCPYCREKKNIANIPNSTVLGNEKLSKPNP